jgi:hypothetical protein
VIITKSKTVLCDNVACEGTERITKNENFTSVFGVSDTLDHEFNLVSNNRLKLGDAPLGEHRIEGGSTKCMEITFGSRESHGIRAESPRHPLVLIIPIFQGV